LPPPSSRPTAAAARTRSSSRPDRARPPSGTTSRASASATPPTSGCPPVYELSEFLVDALDVTDVGAVFPHRVTYHPTCHSLRLLGVGDRPYRLLRSVEGLELIDLPDSEQCCGFGGTFALKNADTSTAMCIDKVERVRRTGAEVLVAGDSSCLMHIGGMLTKTGAPVRVLHLAEVLASTEFRPVPAYAGRPAWERA